MIGSVFLVDTAAPRALLARIGRIDENDGNPGSFCLVGDERSELCERPVMQAGSLTALGRYPSADTFEIFKRYSALGAFGSLNDSLRYYVIGMLLKPRLFAGEFTESAFSCLGAATLETGPAKAEFDTQIIDLSPRVDVFIAICGNVGDAEIDAKPVYRVEGFCLWNLTATS